MASARKTRVQRTLRAFVIEILIYAALVTAYFFAVLHFLGGWLVDLETQHIRVYAVVALLLIIGQAVVLEAVTTTLMRPARSPGVSSRPSWSMVRTVTCGLRARLWIVNVRETELRCP